MKPELPELVHKDLVSTRDYIQEVAHVLGSLQRALVKPDPHNWHHGLEVGPRGLLTQPLMVAGRAERASLDLVRHKVRLGGQAWPLDQVAAPEIFKNIQQWLDSQGVRVKLQPPVFMSGSRHFDSHQADLYASALWWMDRQFNWLKTRLKGGMTSPILLYPHHFDLSLVWFPEGDERQLAIGFSTGDESITEPYIYLTAYPEPAGFTKFALPERAYWQSVGFSGAILPLRPLSTSRDPVSLFQSYAALLTRSSPALLD